MITVERNLLKLDIMTDDELKELIASLAISQAKTDKQMQKTDKQMQKTDKQIQSLKESQEKTDKQIQSLKESQVKTDTQIQSLQNELKETSRLVEKVTKGVDSIGRNHGEITEAYFFNSLKESLTFAGQHYDYISNNLKLASRKQNAEYDIVMYNGKSVAIIEVKHKAHISDLHKLLEQAKSFRKLSLQHKDYKIYLGLSSLAFYPELEEQAQELGIALLSWKGDVVEIQDKNIKAY